MRIITLDGNLARDADLRQVNDTSVCSFRMGNTPYRSEITDWYNVSVWGRYGESLHESLTKGTRVVVVGDESTREYESGGETRQSREIRANSVIVINAKGQRDSETSTGGDDKGDGDGEYGLPI